MAQTRLVATRRGSKHDIEKDDEEGENNGYVPGYVKPLDEDIFSTILSWINVFKSSVVEVQSRSIVAVTIILLSVLTCFILQYDIGEMFKRFCGLIVPSLGILSAFFWLALYFRKSWSTTSIYILFCGGFAGEFIGQCFCSSEGDYITQPALVLWVLVCVSAASISSSLQTAQSCAVIFTVSFTRFIACSALTDLPQMLRPYTCFGAGIIGVVISKYTETVMRPNVNSLLMPDGKIVVIRRRRSSTSSAHGFSSQRAGRRTSLPALIQKSQTPSYESALLGEAHGLITDMLADSSLPPHVVSGLRALGTLLKPAENHSTINKPRISPLVSLTETTSYGSDTEDSPYTGERPSSLPKRLRRSLPPSLIRRMSTSTWTTTTSATGMPTLEPEPCRTRSSSFRYSRDSTPGSSPNHSRSNSPSPMSPIPVSLTIPKSRSFSIATTIVPPGQKWSSTNRRSFFLPHNLEASNASHAKNEVKPLSPLVKHEKLSEAFDCASAAKNSGTQVVIAKRLNITSDYESNDSPSSSDHSDGHVTIEEDKKKKLPQETHVDINQEKINEDSATTIEDREASKDELPYDVMKYENVELLQHSQLCEWDYPIFTCSNQLQEHILSQMAYGIFTETGLFETFRIPFPEFMNFYHALEMGYREKPYHNRVHATDVLHGVYYLVTQPVPGFSQIDPENDLFAKHSSSSESDVETNERPALNHRPSFTADDTYGIVGGNFPAIELMAMFTAAAMHDYDHPGRTNAFLVATNDRLAVLYNDRSVLESHHAASAWSLFMEDPKFNWLCHLDKAEFKRFRYLVIEAILATDLKRHFEFLAEFNAKVNDEEAPGIDWFSETDRLLVSQMAIKLADINGPCKKKELHVSWTMRISEEFYEQGDEESKLGLPISPYMDRKRPQLAKLQESFINHLVAPLCNSFASAGLLPGTWVDGDDDTDDEETESEYEDSSPCKDTEDEGPSPKVTIKFRKKAKKMHCILTKNLKDNHEMWVATIKDEEKQRELAAINVEEADNLGTQDARDDMSPIKEEFNESNSVILGRSDRSDSDVSSVIEKTEVFLPNQENEKLETDKNKTLDSELETGSKPAIEDWGVKPQIMQKKSQLHKTNSSSKKSLDDLCTVVADKSVSKTRKSSNSIEPCIMSEKQHGNLEPSCLSADSCDGIQHLNNNLSGEKTSQQVDSLGFNPGRRNDDMEQIIRSEMEPIAATSGVQ